MHLAILRKESLRFEQEFTEATTLAERLAGRMASAEVAAAIASVHKLGGKSQEVQAALQRDFEELGFRSERTGLFGGMDVPGLRPDFYRRLGRSGIIAEVERGKIITNNMDLLDLWKCHICPDADFLFLIAPLARPSESGTVIKGYEQAQRRLRTFFEPRNYVNVDAAFVFGY